MAHRKIVQFKVKGEIVIENHQDLTEKEIENMKWLVAEELEVPIFDVEAVTLIFDKELSNLDVTSDGILDWNDAYFRTIVGIKMNIEIGSDQYLDAILNNTLDAHLEFAKIN